MNKSDLWGTDLHEPFFFRGVLVAVVLNLIMSIHVINNKETTTS